MVEVFLVLEQTAWWCDDETYGTDAEPIRAFKELNDAISYAEKGIHDLCRVLDGKIVDSPLMERLDGTKDPSLLHRTKSVNYKGYRELLGEAISDTFYDVIGIPFEGA